MKSKGSSGPLAQGSASRPEAAEHGLGLHHDVETARRGHEGQDDVGGPGPALVRERGVGGNGAEAEDEAQGREDGELGLGLEMGVVDLGDDELFGTKGSGGGNGV